MDALRTIAPLFALSALAASLPAGEDRFGEDVAFLKKHTSVVLLADPASGARVAVTPAWQGRVMTSTAGSGSSHGWINDSGTVLEVRIERTVRLLDRYNDGPASPGAKPLGPFDEIETSSPALALAPGERATHVHRTVHVEGAEKELDALARDVLGVGLDDIREALPR